jgi:hypothetical protein
VLSDSPVNVESRGVQAAPAHPLSVAQRPGCRHVGVLGSSYPGAPCRDRCAVSGSSTTPRGGSLRGGRTVVRAERADPLASRSWSATPAKTGRWRWTWCTRSRRVERRGDPGGKHCLVKSRRLQRGFGARKRRHVGIARRAPVFRNVRARCQSGERASSDRVNGDARELVRRAIDARTRELVPYVGNNWDDFDDRFLDRATVRRRDRAASRRPARARIELELAVDRWRSGAGRVGGLSTPGSRPGSPLSQLALERGLQLRQLSAASLLSAPA